MRRALRWVGLENDSGRLSLTTVAVLIGAGLLWRSPVVFIAALGLYAIKKLIQHGQTVTAMEGAQDAGMRKLEMDHGQDVAALAKEVAVLKAKVAEIQMPDRDAALRRIRGGT